MGGAAMTSFRGERWTTRMKAFVNRALSPMNLRVETLTAEHRETARIRALAAAGWFDEPRFPLPAGFRTADPSAILDAVAACRERFDDFTRPPGTRDGYSFENDYFSSPDAEVYYAVIQMLCPNTIVEAGSGHSTRLARQAISDAGLATRLVALDPSPRVPVSGVADEHLAAPAESERADERYRSLAAGDILFVDSSHEIRAANDVVHLLLNVLPSLAPGVVVHIHDVFLPYDYPREWIVDRRWDWNEQYLVQALLGPPSAFDVLWPGSYLQQTLADFARSFPHCGGRRATSLWLRKRAGVSGD
jgi:methyltransferase family protein